MTHASEADRWADHPDDLCTRIAPRFSRIEPRRRARAYLQGLLAPLERKNGWHLAEAAGDASPDGVQDFLARMRWVRMPCAMTCTPMWSSISATLTPCWCWMRPAS